MQADTPRGIVLTGVNLIPRRKEFAYDNEKRGLDHGDRLRGGGVPGRGGDGDPPEAEEQHVRAGRSRGCRTSTCCCRQTIRISRSQTNRTIPDDPGDPPPTSDCVDNTAAAANGPVQHRDAVLGCLQLRRHAHLDRGDGLLRAVGDHANQTTFRVAGVFRKWDGTIQGFIPMETADLSGLFSLGVYNGGSLLGHGEPEREPGLRWARGAGRGV